jgi:hypothetical protein
MHRDVIQVPKLEVKQLYDQRKRRDHARLRSYNTLLEQIYHKIYSTSQLPGTTASILYSVPPFILGLPKMDMEDCIVYIVFQLRTAGFEVKFTWPNLLYISWKHHEAAYLESQNPIVQAMVRESKVAPTFAAPAAAAPLPQPKGGSQKKKALPLQPISGPVKSTVSFSSDIDLITSMPLGTGSTFGSPPKRETSEYIPPDSFLQTMERPGPGRVPGTQVLPSGQIVHTQFNRTPSYGQRAQQQQQHQKNSVLSDLWS